MRLRKRAVSLGAALTLTSALLVGCSQGITMTAPADQKAQPTSALTRQQAATILSDVEKAVAAANAKKDPKLLEPRVGNPALEVRSLQYKSGAPFKEISFDSDSYTPTTAVTWPRSLVVATKTDGKKAPSLLLLNQESARSPYKMVNFARIFSGEKIELIRTDIGAQQYTETAKGFLVTPKEALVRYAVTAGDNSKSDSLHVSKDMLMNAVNSETGGLRSAIGNKGSVKWSASPGQIQGVVAAPNKHALVFATVYFTTDIAKNGDNVEIKLSGPMAAMLGNDGKIAKKAQLKQVAMIVLDLPPANSTGKIRAIAAEMAPLSAKEVK